MTPIALHQLRQLLELSQAEIANELDVSLSEYEALESGTAPIRKLHVLAVERFTMTKIASASGELCHLPITVLVDAISISRMADGILESALMASCVSHRVVH
jgi:DNA-binding XRE family transcriptional regulator